MGQLEGKVAIVTGGASGIGRATSLRFAAEGAAVVVSDLNPSRGGETVAAIKEAGGRAVFVEADTSSERDCDALVAASVAEYGRVDALVAAAGIISATYVSGERGEPRDPAEGLLVNKPLEFWEKVLAVNLTGVMLTDRAVARQMILQGGGGTIVNLASSAATWPLAGSADYCVSKAGVWMLTKVLALELASHRVRVNCIGPGFIDTPMIAGVSENEERRRWAEGLTPLGRLGEPEEIANTALFLSTPESSFFTGEILFPAGGLFHG